MTLAKAPRFSSFEDYLAADPSDLPEGRCEYWDGELVPVMTESIWNDGIANALFVLLLAAGIPLLLIRPGRVEVEVPGRPRTRFPDLLILEEVHLTLLARRSTITRDMPPPRLVVEVVSPGDEKSDNYKRDYEKKPVQYAAIGIPEFWQVDPDLQWVRVGTLINEAYQFTQFVGSEMIVSPTFPEVTLTAEQVLRPGRESGQI